MPTNSVDSILQARFTESSAIHWSGCWGCAVAKKNRLWNLFALAPRLLRSKALFGARFVLWRAQPRNKVPLGFVEGFNNKIRVLQRRAYGLRDEEYLRLKVLTCMLPEL